MIKRSSWTTWHSWQRNKLKKTAARKEMQSYMYIQWRRQLIFWDGSESITESCDGAHAKADNSFLIVLRTLLIKNKTCNRRKDIKCGAWKAAMSLFQGKSEASHSKTPSWATRDINVAKKNDNSPLGIRREMRVGSVLFVEKTESQTWHCVPVL